MKNRIEEAFEKWRADFVSTHTGCFKMIGTDDLSNIAFLAGAEFMQNELNEKLIRIEEIHSNYVNVSCELYEKLKAQNEIMRKALHKVSTHNTLNGDKYNSYEAGWHGVADFANKALKKVGEV